MLKLMLRWGSKAVPAQRAGCTGFTFMTSLSPTCSSFVSGLIQVLIAQRSSPHGSMITRALPSPRAQLPRSGDPAANAFADMPTPMTRTRLARVLLFISVSFSRQIDRIERGA